MIQQFAMAIVGVLISFGSLGATRDEAKFQERVANDLQTIRQCDAGLAATIAFVRLNPKIFSVEPDGLLSLTEKDQARTTWKAFADYELALEQITHRYRNYSRMPGAQQATAFYICYGAGLTQYRYALEFLNLTANNPLMDQVLNEPIPELGLNRDGYFNFKFYFLHLGRGTEFAAREVIRDSYDRKFANPLGKETAGHSRYIWGMGKGRGQVMTLKNAWKIVGKRTSSAWLPIQTGVSEWMGDTKVWRVNRSLISAEQIAGLELLPGDILLERREWYLSNIGLPGYWPHSALFVGTVEERRRFFNDAETQAWVRSQGETSGDFERLLDRDYEQTYRKSAGSEHNHPYRVIEAVSEGVVFTTIEHSADADSLAVLRPKLKPVEKAVAIYKALKFAGRPYDFNFDFDSDDTVVCTELVLKAYERTPESRGIEVPVGKMLGRKVTSANDFVRRFDEQYGTDQEQWALVCFLDGNDKINRAEVGSVEDFRRSWRRPKWHILTQAKPKAEITSRKE